MEAVRGGHLRVLEQLALARPDLGLRDALGRTALMIAVASKHPDPAICRLLVAMGGDPHAPGPDGRSAIEQARALGRHPLVAALGSGPGRARGSGGGGGGRRAPASPSTDPLTVAGGGAGAWPARARRAAARDGAPSASRLAALALETTDPEVLRWLAARAGITARTPLPDGRLLGAALAEEPGAWRRLAVLDGGREPFLGRGRLAELDPRPRRGR
ncbi:MAG: ankyrin repeat domain-containing protein [Xanthomonadales bacterium]|nr:ankyrin repeat domain-containing protein [Xanthomonadales bacterium]